MNRRFFSFLLALALLLSLLPATVLAAEDGLQYEFAIDGGEMYAIVTGYTGTEAELLIPSVIDGIAVKAIGDSAFKQCKALTKVTIPEGITSIGETAFTACPNLTDVILPSTLTDMGWLIFLECTALKSVTIPEGVPQISYGMFDNCKSLTTVAIPDSVTIIDSYAFSRCSSLNEIVIPEGVTCIGHQAFYGCTKLTSITIPEGVTLIGYQAFMECKRLESVTIPASVKELGDRAFCLCSKLSEVKFCGDAPEIGYMAFSNVTATAYYPKDNPTWTDEVMRDCKGNLTWVPYALLPFADTPVGAYYYDSVAWAVDNGITSGTAPDEFSPYDSCLRSQVVTFLWRAAGEPKAEAAVNPFVDVKSSDYYYDAVLWAVEKGITTGADATHFEPNGVCNRSQVVTFLYRAFDKPPVEGAGNPFTDVSAGAWYAPAVLWAVNEGITNGLSEHAFGPNEVCNRSQVVTFLHRAYVN